MDTRKSAPILSIGIKPSWSPGILSTMVGGACGTGSALLPLRYFSLTCSAVKRCSLNELAIVISPQPFELAHEWLHGFQIMFWQTTHGSDTATTPCRAAGLNDLSELSTAL
jgi:hypothetical protein